MIFQDLLLAIMLILLKKMFVAEVFKKSKAI